MKRRLLLLLTALSCLTLGACAGAEPEAPPLYTLLCAEAEGGSYPAGMDKSHINGQYAEGSRILVMARPLPGYDFDQWTSSGGGTFEDPNRASTYFITPAEDTVITARFINIK